MDSALLDCDNFLVNLKKNVRFYFVSFLALVLLGITSCQTRHADISTIPTLNLISANSKVKVSFVGVSTLLFDDGETSFMTDGFFTRPGIWKVLLGRVTSDESVVTQSLEKLGVKTLAAVIPVHSHYDHALDSAMVVKKTNAVLIGSKSSANIGRSFGLAENQIKEVQDGAVVNLGKFKITFIESAHSPDAFFKGVIDHPFEVPAKASQFQMGDCYSLLIEHEGQKILVHGSAGYLPGKLREVKADVIYLGIGTLGKQSSDFMNTYWDEVVKATHARRIVLVHWDDFFKPLSEPLTPLPWPMDGVNTAVDFLKPKAAKENVDLRVPKMWQPSDPWADLVK